MRVSPTGTEWTAVDGLAGVGEDRDSIGGSMQVEVTADAVFVIEVPLDGNRVLWVLRVEGG